MTLQKTTEDKKQVQKRRKIPFENLRRTKRKVALLCLRERDCLIQCEQLQYLQPFFFNIWSVYTFINGWIELTEEILTSRVLKKLSVLPVFNFDRRSMTITTSDLHRIYLQKDVASISKRKINEPSSKAFYLLSLDRQRRFHFWNSPTTYCLLLRVYGWQSDT